MSAPRCWLRTGSPPHPRLKLRRQVYAWHQADFHVIVLDERGRGIYGPPANGEFYPAEALKGTGTVGERAVKCTTPEWLVRSHTGYELDETDWSDVSALSKRFGIPIPDEYARFRDWK